MAGKEVAISKKMTVTAQDPNTETPKAEAMEEAIDLQETAATLVVAGDKILSLM